MGNFSRRPHFHWDNYLQVHHVGQLPTGAPTLSPILLHSLIPDADVRSAITTSRAPRIDNVHRAYPKAPKSAIKCIQPEAPQANKNRKAILIVAE